MSHMDADQEVTAIHLISANYPEKGEKKYLER